MSERLTDEQLRDLVDQAADPRWRWAAERTLERLSSPLDLAAEVLELRAKVAELEAERWPIPDTRGDERYTACALLRRVVRGAALTTQRRRERKRFALMWSAVGELTGLGSGYSAALCRHFGFDHDTGEEVGDE